MSSKEANTRQKKAQVMPPVVEIIKMFTRANYITTRLHV